MNELSKVGDFRICEHNGLFHVQMWDEQPGHTGWFSCDREGQPRGSLTTCFYGSLKSARIAIKNNFSYSEVKYHKP